MVVKAHYDGKVFVPDEPVELKPHEAVVLRVEPVAPLAPTPQNQTATDAEPERPEDDAFWDRLDSLVVDDPSLPTDLSYQHDHYLYGTPKKPSP